MTTTKQQKMNLEDIRLSIRIDKEIKSKLEDSDAKRILRMIHRFGEECYEGGYEDGYREGKQMDDERAALERLSYDVPTVET